jgi:sporulation protein YqfC
MKPEKDSVLSALQIPKDVVQGTVLMWITGRQELCLENYRCIVSYTQEQIRMQAKDYQVVIQGKHLHIDYYTCETMKISGWIHAITYE